MHKTHKAADVDNEENKSPSIDSSHIEDKGDVQLALLKNEYKEYKIMMQTLIESAAHELKSPVANLKLITLLIENTKDGNELLKYLDSIKESINRLNSSIVGLAKIFQTLNQDPEILENLNVNELVNEAIATHKQKIEALGATVENKIDKSFKLTYPLEYLKFIFNELLENSLKYKGDKTPLKIKVDGKEEDGHLKITFKDTGSGMDLVKYGKNLFRAFKRFSQNQQGSGAGLFTIKSMIEKNKGKIEVDSVLNEGTQITLFFKPYKV